MSEPLSVAFVWHMHQPYYRDGSGRFVLPWVRRRASKDYGRMIDAATRHPGLRITMNHVPTLLEQLEAYAGGDVTDVHRDLALRDASTLSRADREFLVRFTRASDFPRRVPMFDNFYRLLAGLPDDGSALDDGLIRDLQVWVQLIWLDAADIERDPTLRSLVRRGRAFTEADKRVVDDAQLARVRDVVPKLRRAIASGCVEPMTSPYAHPILPLLIDQESARVARPELALPRAELRFRHPEDAAAHMTVGLQQYERIVGVRPGAIWPSECAVSPDAAAAIAASGASWALSDEGVLARSLGASVRGDTDAMARLYSPYREHSGLRMVFRDSVLSNRIGFDYAAMATRDAVDDLVGTLEGIASAKPAGAAWLVVIALDGENCWDYYEDNGAAFLDGTYTRLLASPLLRSVHVGEFLAAHDDTVRELGAVWSGSWIDADYATWIGEPAHTRAWELLEEARAAVDAAGGGERHPEAFRQMLIAEGSDWFWWFSSRHQSGIDAAWDALYRMHLRHAYELIAVPPPADLEQPILDAAEALRGVGPLRAIDPSGPDDTEWHAAGIASAAGVFGAMQPAHTSVDHIQFGASESRLHLRIGESPARFDRAEVSLSGLPVIRVDRTSPVVSIAVRAGQPIGFSLRLREQGRGEQRIPASGDIEVPRLETSPVVVVAVECAPIAVAGELAQLVRHEVDRLLRQGRTCVVVLPHHPSVARSVRALRSAGLRVAFGGHPAMARVWQGALAERAIVLSIDEPALFGRESIYGDIDDSWRYAFFARAAFDLIDATALRPSTVHGFEWQSAITLALLSRSASPRPRLVFSSGQPPVTHWVSADLLSEARLAQPGESSVELTALGGSAAHVPPMDRAYD